MEDRVVYNWDNMMRSRKKLGAMNKEKKSKFFRKLTDIAAGYQGALTKRERLLSNYPDPLLHDGPHYEYSMTEWSLQLMCTVDDLEFYQNELLKLLETE